MTVRAMSYVQRHLRIYLIVTSWVSWGRPRVLNLSHGPTCVGAVGTVPLGTVNPRLTLRGSLDKSPQCYLPTYESRASEHSWNGLRSATREQSAAPIYVVVDQNATLFTNLSQAQRYDQ